MMNSRLIVLLAIQIALVTILTVTHNVFAGNKGKKDHDIILFNNNLLIRGKKGKGNLLIANNDHKHGHYESHDHHHHEGLEHKLIAEAIMENKGKRGGGSYLGASQKKKEEAGWEKFVMGGGFRR